MDGLRKFRTLFAICASIWIDYFRSGDHSQYLDDLIDENLVAINDIILTELVPYLRMKRQTDVINLLYEVKALPLAVDWKEIIEFQVKCLQRGINGIGIPDLMIV